MVKAFPKFSRLPYELRSQIWELAIQEQIDTSVLCSSSRQAWKLEWMRRTDPDFTAADLRNFILSQPEDYFGNPPIEDRYPFLRYDHGSHDRVELTITLGYANQESHKKVTDYIRTHGLTQIDEDHPFKIVRSMIPETDCLFFHGHTQLLIENTLIRYNGLGHTAVIKKRSQIQRLAIWLDPSDKIGTCDLIVTPLYSFNQVTEVLLIVEFADGEEPEDIRPELWTIEDLHETEADVLVWDESKHCFNHQGTIFGPGSYAYETLLSALGREPAILKIADGMKFRFVRAVQTDAGILRDRAMARKAAYGSKMRNVMRYS